MLSIAVCDDEKCISEKMEKMAKDFFRKKNTDIAVVQYSSGEELLESSKEMDILFLDIGMQGMVFRSFEVQPFDDLVKPVQAEDFDKTMERLFRSLQDKEKGFSHYQFACVFPVFTIPITVSVL